MNPIYDKNYAKATRATLRGLLAVGCLVAAPMALAAASTINIGVTAPQETLEGKSIVNGAKLAADHINAAGGIDGKQIKLFFYDDHKSASDGVRAMQRAANRDHTVAMVGTFISEVALSMEPWSARLKLPFIVTGAASPKITQRIHDNYSQYKYVFRDKLNSHFMAESVIDFIQTTLAPKGFKSAAIMSEDSAWTIPLGNTWKQNLKSKAGVNVVKEIRYSPDTNDFGPIFSKIEGTGAHLILTGWAHTGLRPTIQWSQRQVPALLVGVNAQAGSSSFWQQSNGATQGVISQSSAVPGAALSDKTEPFTKAYHAKYNNYPGYTGYTTYDAIYLLKNAIEKAKSANADKLVSALETTDATGTIGHIKFYGKQDKYTHDLQFGPGLATGVLFQWQDGKQVPVWPASVAKPVEIPSYAKAGS
ncbi:MAG: ABC transporter substrate-binding protein [Salinisphaera sp.]|jgi:branched-chain amino acid transport system substrate-binding protein|nr:ABC transporter substrate-binding protein [Salinisphaera sp.]